MTSWDLPTILVIATLVVLVAAFLALEWADRRYDLFVPKAPEFDQPSHVRVIDR